MAGTTITAHSAIVIAAVAWPLGHDAAATCPSVTALATRGSAVSHLSAWVVTFAPTRTTTAVPASHGRRRTSATATIATDTSANGAGSAKRAIATASGSTRGPRNPRKPV